MKRDFQATNQYTAEYGTAPMAGVEESSAQACSFSKVSAPMHACLSMFLEGVCPCVEGMNLGGGRHMTQVLGLRHLRNAQRVPWKQDQRVTG